MTKQKIEKRIAEAQKIQRQNPPASIEWLDAHLEIHMLAELIGGAKHDQTTCVDCLIFKETK